MKQVTKTQIHLHNMLRVHNSYLKLQCELDLLSKQTNTMRHQNLTT